LPHNSPLNPNYALEICDESSKCNKIKCLTFILIFKRVTITVSIKIDGRT